MDEAAELARRAELAVVEKTLTAFDPSAVIAAAGKITEGVAELIAAGGAPRDQVILDAQRALRALGVPLTIRAPRPEDGGLGWREPGPLAAVRVLAAGRTFTPLPMQMIIFACIARGLDKAGQARALVLAEQVNRELARDPAGWIESHA